MTNHRPHRTTLDPQVQAGVCRAAVEFDRARVQRELAAMTGVSQIVTAMPNEQRSELIAALHALANAAGEPQPLPAAGVLGW